MSLIEEMRSCQEFVSVLTLRELLEHTKKEKAGELLSKQNKSTDLGRFLQETIVVAERSVFESEGDFI